MKTLQERFDDKWIGEPNSGCWLWTGATYVGGYGVMASGEKNRTEGAHRVSWRIHKGQVPDGMSVLHRCDVRCCVNPDHLFLGTQAQNIRDAMAKNRVQSKLTEEYVRAIRASTESQYKLGKKYGVDPSTICRVRLREDHASVR